MANVPLPPLVDRPVRIGQIGLAGGIAPMHLNEQEKNPNFVTVAGCDVRLDDPNVIKQAQRIKTGGGKIYPDYHALLLDPEVEAVCIAAPHFLHEEMTVAAFRAGKHVLCEKPMATHPQSCRAMLDAQIASGKVGAVQMQHVGRSSMLDLRQALHSGVIGRIREIFLSSLWWREDAYYGRVGWAGKKMINGGWNLDGVMFNQAVHFINQSLVLAAPGELPAVSQVKDLSASLYRFHETPALEMEDTAVAIATLDTPDQPRLIVVATTCHRQERHVIEILGEKGRALWNGTGYLFPDGQPGVEFHDDNREFEGSTRTFNSFATAIRHGSKPITDFAEIMHTTEFIFSCYQTANWAIRPVPWSTTGELPENFRRMALERKLPKNLSPRPSWA